MAPPKSTEFIYDPDAGPFGRIDVAGNPSAIAELSRAFETAIGDVLAGDGTVPDLRHILQKQGRPLKTVRVRLSSPTGLWKRSDDVDTACRTLVEKILNPSDTSRTFEQSHDDFTLTAQLVE